MEPISEYERLEHLNPDNLDWFVVNWCLGNTCNFSCSYCPVNLHDGSLRWHSTKNVKDFVDKIKTYHPNKKIYFEFTGGEVTLNKDFIEICKFCTESGVKVGFISNGSRTIRWWEENKIYFDAVMLSFHSEFADPDHFVKVAQVLHEDVRLHVNVMMNPEKWNECMALAMRIKDVGNCSMALQPLMHDLSGDLYDYRPGQHYVLSRQHKFVTSKIKQTKSFEIYRGAMKVVRSDGTSEPRTAHSFISRETNNWKDWQCYSGVEQLIVDMNGSVWRGWCRVGGPIGFIDDPSLVLPTVPIVCNKDRCHCNFDIMSTKIKSEKNL